MPTDTRPDQPQHNFGHPQAFIVALALALAVRSDRRAVRMACVVMLAASPPCSTKMVGPGHTNRYYLASCFFPLALSASS